MSAWKVTPPLPPGWSSPVPKKRRLKPLLYGFCDCGKRAVARRNVKVGVDGVYTVTLRLCAECLEIEEGFSKEET